MLNPWVSLAWVCYEQNVQHNQENNSIWIKNVEENDEKEEGRLISQLNLCDELQVLFV